MRPSFSGAAATRSNNGKRANLKLLSAWLERKRRVLKRQRNGEKSRSKPLKSSPRNRKDWLQQRQHVPKKQRNTEKSRRNPPTSCAVSHLQRWERRSPR